MVCFHPRDLGQTLGRCARGWWVHFTRGYAVWSSASVATLLSEEVTSIHPITLLAQARQLWEIGNSPGFLSETLPKMRNWVKCRGNNESRSLNKIFTWLLLMPIIRNAFRVRACSSGRRRNSGIYVTGDCDVTCVTRGDGPARLFEFHGSQHQAAAW